MKGQFCPYEKAKFCQEDEACKECPVYKQWLKNKRRE